jgi:hypothetical protein
MERKENKKQDEMGKWRKRCRLKSKDQWNQSSNSERKGERKEQDSSAAGRRGTGRGNLISISIVPGKNQERLDLTEGSGRDYTESHRSDIRYQIQSDQTQPSRRSGKSMAGNGRKPREIEIEKKRKEIKRSRGKRKWENE